MEALFELYENSELLDGYGSFQEDEFIRLVNINAQNEREDILNFFQILENFVEEHDSIFSGVLQEK